jgi:predicted nucleic acid-binding protein
MDILKDADSWAQGDLAMDRWGRSCSIYDEDAARRCLLGALIYVYRGRDLEEASKRVANSIGAHFHYHGNIVQWNDDPHRTFEDVRRVIEISNV